MKNISQFIIYGAGNRGMVYYDFFVSEGLKDFVFAFCDKDHNRICKYKDKQVYSYEEVKSKGIPFLITMMNKKDVDEVKSMMDEDGIQYYTFDDIANFLNLDKVAFNRNFCAYYHIKDMDQYFASAECDASMNIFWHEKTEFYKMFKQLNISKVIELACGRGRHVRKYINIASDITIVDILEDNINYCKERYKDYVNVTYYCNNGYNLKKLPSNSYTALFSYDAMVHFEMMDIYEYLKDIYRVLISGGRVLIHHSNYDNDYKASFVNAPSGRSFMNTDIFAYLAFRVGFTVLDQKKIDWDGKTELDAITLLEK